MHTFHFVYVSLCLSEYQHNENALKSVVHSGHWWSHFVITHMLTNFEDDVKPFDFQLFLTLCLPISNWVFLYASDNRSIGLFKWTSNLVWLIEMINILCIYKVMMNKNFRPNKSRTNSIAPPSNWQSKCL